MDPGNSRDSNAPVSTKLHEKDIPGASLNGRDPSSLKVPELKRWPICRGASTRENKPDLILRYIITVDLFIATYYANI